MNGLVVILGPTATGKSSLALALAREVGGEIVNADALQVYRGLEIGTAKPSAADRARVPHHLVDILEPSSPFSAGEFARRGRRAIDEIRRRGGIPIVVGGSGFYLKALLEGLSPIPPVTDSVREAVNKHLEEQGLEKARAELAEVDPAWEERLAPGDRQRVMRGLEVWKATGRTLSSWQSESARTTRLEARKVGLTLQRTVLYDRIALRAKAMIANGWVDEVRELLAAGNTGSEPAFQAIGYREVVGHLLNEVPLAEVLERIIVATRQYARRQLTWFRRDAAISWHDASDRKALTSAVLQQLQGGDTFHSGPGGQEI